MFKTPEDQARYFAAYDKTLARWPVPVETVEIQGCFGTTHINVCGPAGAQPLVLLHGAAVSSTMWYPNVAGLSRYYRLYAPDIMGEMGKSVSSRPITRPLDYVDWLQDMCSGLGLEKAHFAGLSQGGFLALQLAISAPGRVGGLVLLAPSASLLPLRLRFYVRAVAAILVPFLSPEGRQKLLLGAVSPTAKPAFEQLLTRTDFRYRLIFPRVFTDLELQGIKVPTLLLLGADEVIYDPKLALERAARLIPDLEAEIIPGAGHALTFDQPEKVNQRILGFLKKADGIPESVERSQGL